MLEKQLDHMRAMVQEAEQGRHEAIQNAARKAQDKRQASEANQRSQRDQISQLERDRVKLAATQNLAQVIYLLYVGLIVKVCSTRELCVFYRKGDRQFFN